MKKKIYFTLYLLLITSGILYGQRIDQNNQSLTSSFNIVTSPELTDLVGSWVRNYNAIYPNVHINVKTTNQSELTDGLNNKKELRIILSEENSTERNEENWEMVLGRDILVPVVNSKNPFYNELSLIGISPESLSEYFKKNKLKSWGTLLKRDESSPLNYYLTGDESVNSRIAQFVGVKKISVNGITVKDATELLTAIQTDPLALGFSKMTDIISFNKKNKSGDISLVPVDLNKNGQIEYKEKIYGNIDEFFNGVSYGDYPNELSYDLVCVSPSGLLDENKRAFLAWVISHGQSSLNNTGYTDLVYTEKLRNLGMMSADDVNANLQLTEFSYKRKSVFRIAAYVMVILIILLSIETVVFWFIRRRRELSREQIPTVNAGLRDQSFDIPKGLWYDKTHTWAIMKKDGLVKIGIDDFLQRITGPVSSVKMNNIGKKIRKRDKLFSILQNGKQLDIYSPVTGIIKARNENLLKKSGLINTSPYSEGWVYLIEPVRWVTEMKILISAESYKEWLKSELSRLKDFLMTVMASEKEGSPRLVFQDGGVPGENVLEHLGPEVWDDFQTEFLETSV